MSREGRGITPALCFYEQEEIRMLQWKIMASTESKSEKSSGSGYEQLLKAINGVLDQQLIGLESHDRLQIRIEVDDEAL